MFLVCYNFLFFFIAKLRKKIIFFFQIFYFFQTFHFFQIFNFFFTIFFSPFFSKILFFHVFLIAIFRKKNEIFPFSNISFIFQTFTKKRYELSTNTNKLCKQTHFSNKIIYFYWSRTIEKKKNKKTREKKNKNEKNITFYMVPLSFQK